LRKNCLGGEKKRKKKKKKKTPSCEAESCLVGREISHLHRTKKFITVLTAVRDCYLWARCIHSTSFSVTHPYMFLCSEVTVHFRYSF
jgi:hypothetical protein